LLIEFGATIHNASESKRKIYAWKGEQQGCIKVRPGGDMETDPKPEIRNPKSE
jgi:hypothetical protein